jgi:hypothetical protein
MRKALAMGTILVAPLLFSCSSDSAGPGGSVASIAMAPDSAFIEVGDTLRARVDERNSAGDPVNVPVTWSSETPGVAEVALNGFVTGKTAGTTRILAAAGSASAAITVTVATPVSQLVLEPVDTVRHRGTITVGIGAKAGGVTRPVPEHLTLVGHPAGILAPRWDAQRGKAFVDVVEGTAWLVATAPSGISDSVKIVVVPDVYEVNPDFTSLGAVPQHVYPITVHAPGADGQGAVHPSLTWSSSNPAVAIVDQNGKVTTLASGTTRITAKAPTGRPASIEVSVAPSIASHWVLDTISTAVSLATIAQLVVPNGTAPGDTVSFVVRDTNVIGPIARIGVGGPVVLDVPLPARHPGRTRIIASGPGMHTDSIDVLVTSPRPYFGTIFVNDLISIDSGLTVQVQLGDSLGFIRGRAVPVTLTVTSSNPAVMAIDPASQSLTLAADSSVRSISVKGTGTGVAWILVQSPGMLTDSFRVGVSAPRLAFGVAMPANVAPYIALRARNHFTVGVGLSLKGELIMGSSVTAGHPDIPVTFTHSNPAADSMPSTLLYRGIAAVEPLAVTGRVSGTDTIVASAPGFLPDTLFLLVTPSHFVVPDTIRPFIDPVANAYLGLRMADSTGALHEAADSFTVTLSSSNTAVISPPSPQTVLGSPNSSLITLGLVHDTATALLTFQDTQGRMPAKVVVVRPAYDAHLAFNLNGSTFGFHQKLAPSDVQVVNAAPIHPGLTAAVVSTNPASLAAPATAVFGPGVVTLDFPVSIGTVAGQARLVASAPLYRSDTSVTITVGQPSLRLRFVPLATATYAGSSYRAWVELAAPLGNPMNTDTALVFDIVAPDGGLTPSSGSLHVPAGRSASDTVLVHVDQPGTFRLVARDARGLSWSYRGDTATVRPVLPPLLFQNGGYQPVPIHQHMNLGISRPDPVRSAAVTVTVSHRGSHLSAPASISLASDSSVAIFDISGLSYGTDTLIVSAPGYASDTLAAPVAAGFLHTSDVLVTAGDSVPFLLQVGPGRMTQPAVITVDRDAGSATLTDGHQAITEITIPAGAYQGAPLYVRAGNVTTATTVTLTFRSLDFVTTTTRVFIQPH